MQTMLMKSWNNEESRWQTLEVLVNPEPVRDPGQNAKKHEEKLGRWWQKEIRRLKETCRVTADAVAIVPY